jgi:hypothetical protein
MIRNTFALIVVLFVLLSGCASSRLEMRPYERGEVTPWCTSIICPSGVIQKFLADFWKKTPDGKGMTEEFLTEFNRQLSSVGFRLRLPSAAELGHRSHDRCGCDEAVEYILTYRSEDALSRPLYRGEAKWTVSLRTYRNPHIEWDGSNLVFKADEVVHRVEFDVWEDQTKN